MTSAFRKILIILSVYDSIVWFVLVYNRALTEDFDPLRAFFAALLVAIVFLSFIPFTSEKAFYSGSKRSTEGLSCQALLLFIIAILCLGVIVSFYSILIS
jgi:hypothetical protein